ncbi:hypothetical protein M758_6G019200 [Ceratodon purpureus]|uniref:GTP diphosphokinase n=1 Tax=Ceratodon purpureus TaxID=3225 RepID=A0A8T0HAM4_CERPU|nr:hypothetical protein KC19_6G021700 [Ceratodon purpureus]KAG0612326.1 hypothetical protein M758_6G019200 [Ceratodon purpureus]
MAVCACSTGLLQLLPKAPAVTSSLSSQLRPEKGVQVQCAVTSLSADCVCSLGYGGSKGTLIHSSSLDNSQKRSSFRHGRSNRGGGDFRKGHKGCGRLEHKQIIHVQARVQDIVEHETYDGNELDGNNRSRDRSRRQNNGGERRRRVQVITNNGFVDLEEQLGIKKETKEGKLKLRLSSQQNRNRVQRDEEGRLYFEYDFNGAEVDDPDIESSSFYSAEELQTRQEGDAPSLAQAATPLEIGTFLASERDTGRGAGLEFGAEEQWSSEQEVEIESESSKLLLGTPGGQRVAELVGAWDGLAGRLPPDFATKSGSKLLLAALKLTVGTLQHASPIEDGRKPLSRALSVAFILADLRMDAEVIAAGLLREVVEIGYLSISEVEKVLGNEVGVLLKDCSRVKHMPSLLETLDDASVKAVRQYCLAFHDVRAVVVEVAARLDTMRYVQVLPKYKQQILALETMQIYAPLAHAMGTGKISHELEDLGFWVLFPDSYSYIGSWLKEHFADGNDVVQQCRDNLRKALKEDSEMNSLIETVKISGRCKSKYSTMKKLLRDGRSPEEVFDVLGLRVILVPKKETSKENCARACYRTLEIATTLWDEVPGRLKDYIAKPKKNGYESLHLAVALSNRGNWSPLMEIQIRTAEMDAMAEGGLASHSLYKGGLTDPEQAGYLKAIMQAAADVATTRFSDLTNNTVEVIGGSNMQNTVNDHMFTLFDKNNDGVISMDEFKDVIGELGGDGEDAHELMKLVDSNFDGSVSQEEFKDFRRQVKIFENLAGVDRQFTTQLDQKLLTAAATSQNGNGTVSEEKSSTTGSEVLLQLDDIMTAVQENAVESIAKTNGSAIPSTSVQEVDYPSKELEQQMWMDRVSDSAKGSTSSSGVQSPARLAKPSKPAPVSAEKFNVGNGVSDVYGAQRYPWQSSTIGEVEKEDTTQLYSQESDAESDLDRALATARKQLAAGDIRGAHGMLQKLAKKHPSNADVMVHLAQLERKRGDSVAAGAYYERAVGIFKEGDYCLNHVKALQAWGSLEAQARNSGRARYLYLESVRIAHRGERNGVQELKGAGVYGLHGWAMLEQKIGNWGKARELLERAAKIQPGNAVVHQTRALLESRAHNFAAARYHFRLAVESAPEDVKCWQAWALFEANQGKRGKMRQLFQKALDVEPGNVYALQAWAHQESLQDSDSARERARKLYQRCVDVNPGNVHSWQAWALMEHQAGNVTAARVLFERGLGVNPQSIPCLQAYAHMERVSGNLKAAQKLLMAAVTLDYGNSAVLMEIALTEEAMGNQEVAAEYFRKAGILDKQKSRVKRRMFESRKAVPKFKVPKSKDSKSTPSDVQPI